MNIQEISEIIKESGHKKVQLAVVDIDGILRGKVISLEKFLSVAEGGLGFCNVVFGWDSGDKSYDNVSFTGWHTGYPDTGAHIDLDTFRRIPWDQDLPFFLADFSGTKKDGLAVCPRTLLKSIRKRAEDMGFHPLFSQEFEWFNFDTTPQQIKEGGMGSLQHLTPGMFGYSILRASLKRDYFNDLFDLCGKFDIPLEGLHTETGPGVYEAAIGYSDIVTAADRAVLFKTSVKEIAYRHGIMATFMAKWSPTLPGNGGHVHQSLWDLDVTQNRFFDAHAPNKMSEIMKSYVAGQLFCLPHILPMYAPLVNSYKRLVVGAWAPTTLTWGMDNRTTALRVISGSNTSTRLETRVIGSDVNPYLAMAACLASGLYGIANQLELTTPETVGNGYLDDKNGRLPGDLKEATSQMKKSAVAKELFGEEFVQHFTQTREWEWREFSSQVTDWERNRYFEII